MQERVPATISEVSMMQRRILRRAELPKLRYAGMLALLAATGTAGLTAHADAQAAAPEVPVVTTAPVVTATPVVTAAPFETPAPAVAMPAEAPPAVVAPAPAAVAAEPEPKVAPAPEVPKLKIGIGVRTGLALSKTSGVKDMDLSLNDGLVDQIQIRPYFSGQLTKRVSVVANFEVGTPGGLGVFNILDAIAQVKFMDELQLWVGQHIPASDRSSFCGPFFHNSWNFPVATSTFPFDTSARDRGFTLWGFAAKGIVKYHASVVDLQPGNNIQNARLAGRVTINLLDPENYYYASGTYYGAQDTLAVGAVVQYQNGLSSGASNGTVPLDIDGDGKVDNDFLAFSADLLFEKNLHEAGVFTLEGAYWNMDGVGKEYVVNQSSAQFGKGVSGPSPGQSFLVAVSWLTPKNVGAGKIQPNARFQYGSYTDQWSSATSTWGDVKNKVLDAGIAYVVDGFNHRWHLNYRHSDLGGLKGNMAQAGVQFQL
jgi:hypothetical protein